MFILLDSFSFSGNGSETKPPEQVVCLNLCDILMSFNDAYGWTWKIKFALQLVPRTVYESFPFIFYHT